MIALEFLTYQFTLESNYTSEEIPTNLDITSEIMTDRETCKCICMYIQSETWKQNASGHRYCQQGDPTCTLLGSLWLQHLKKRTSTSQNCEDGLKRGCCYQAHSWSTEGVTYTSCVYTIPSESWDVLHLLHQFCSLSVMDCLKFPLILAWNCCCVMFH